MNLLRGLVGIAFILGLCFALSRSRKAVSWRLVGSGIALQVVLGLCIFQTDAGLAAMRAAAGGFQQFLDFSYQGSAFLFGPLGMKSAPDGNAYLAFQMLPIVIYFAAVMGILYHLGVMQVVVYGMSRALSRLLRISGAESMAVTANIFVGMTEAPLAVRPYLSGMTRSELVALMTGGFATVAGSVLGIYLNFVGTDYAPFLIAASVMSAPAAFVAAKIIVPETGQPATGAQFSLRFERTSKNLLDAIAQGVTDGLKLALNIGAMLIAFYALLSLVNWPLEAWLGVTLQDIFGYILRPLAFLIGVDWTDSFNVGKLLGQKICLNEFLAYKDLHGMIARDELSPRSIKLASFALCGFANFGSIGVTLGGLGQLIPERREELTQLAFRAMLAGALASFLTAAVAGIFL